MVNPPGPPFLCSKLLQVTWPEEKPFASESNFPEDMFHDEAQRSGKLANFFKFELQPLIKPLKTYLY